LDRRTRNFTDPGRCVRCWSAEQKATPDVTPIRYYIVCRERFSLYSSTGNGNQVIHTAELCGANLLDYLTELQRHAAELATQRNRHRVFTFKYAAASSAVKDEELYVAVLGGQPILDMVSALPDRKRPNVHYYAGGLIGRGTMMRNAPHVGSEANATIAWSRSGRLQAQKMVVSAISRHKDCQVELGANYQPEVGAAVRPRNLATTPCRVAHPSCLSAQSPASKAPAMTAHFPGGTPQRLRIQGHTSQESDCPASKFRRKPQARLPLCYPVADFQATAYMFANVNDAD
jgi:hypothetical protein